jgi:hypothetical protein
MRPRAHRRLGDVLLLHVERGLDAQAAVEEVAVAVALRRPAPDGLDEVGRGDGVERRLAREERQRLVARGRRLRAVIAPSSSMREITYAWRSRARS